MHASSATILDVKLQTAACSKMSGGSPCQGVLSVKAAVEAISRVDVLIDIPGICSVGNRGKKDATRLLINRVPARDIFVHHGFPSERS